MCDKFLECIVGSLIKHYIICIFFIHSGSVQKMSTALFNLEYTENYTDNFFEYQYKMFLNIEKVLVKITEKQPLMHYSIVFLHIFEIKVSNFY